MLQHYVHTTIERVRLERLHKQDSFLENLWVTQLSLQYEEQQQ
jgi:hypothetical protein